MTSELKNTAIVLVNYNNYEDTIESVDSLLVASVPSSSIIVVDNNSQNNSVKEIKNKFEDIYLIKSSKNLGFSGGNNLGIKYALKHNFKFIVLLNNDTIVEKNAIQILTKEMQSDDFLGIATGLIKYFPEKDKIWYNGGKLIPSRGLAIHYNYGDNSTILAKCNNRKVDFVSGCYLCIRSSVIDKLGLLSEDYFLYLEDIDYSARAKKLGVNIGYFPKSIIYHKSRGEKLLTENQLYYSIRNRKLLIQKHFSIFASIYFSFVILVKQIIWYFSSKIFFKVSIEALSDYKKGYFGERK